MKDPFYLQWLSSWGIDAIPSNILMRGIVGLLVIFISMAAWLISRRLAQKLLPKLISHTKNHWDDVLMKNHLFSNLALLIPGFMMYSSVSWVLYDYPAKIDILQNVIGVYLILVIVRCLDAVLKSILKIYIENPLTKDIAQELPLKRFVQILRILLYGCALLLIFALILNKSLFYFFNGVDSLQEVAKPRSTLERFISGLFVMIISFVAWYICRHVVHRILPKLILHTKNKWDDVLMQHHFFRNLALLIPGIILTIAIPSVFNGDEYAANIAANIVSVYLIFAGVLCVDALMNSLLEIYRTLPLSQEIPLTGFVQITKIVLYSCCVLFAIAIILNRSPLYIFSGLGAMTAVLMLIFKDPILGFVAGIQLISNRMLKQGDWIEMPKYGADGDVVDITLSTVKVRNFDKTITTIPTYALIADSFKNWRGMKECGGRRIKRALHIDINSICFCDQDMLDRFAENSYICDYIKRKNQEISEHNTKLIELGTVPLTKRRLTNIGTFRAYIHSYLRHHPLIHQDMTFLVRQLPPTANGLPLEIYVFCKDNDWAVYEEVQADIFDHLLAIAPEFDLRVYQFPCGRDIKSLESIFKEGRRVLDG
jgi:miniconductance mechanosensitive channel